jgi:hypothetical protein
MIEFRATLTDLENNSKKLLSFKILASSHRMATRRAYSYIKKLRIYEIDERVRDYVNLSCIMEIPEGMESSGLQVDVPPEVFTKLVLTVRRLS